MAETIKWNDKLKLALGELETKIQRERAARARNGVWPEPEQVEAWNAERMRQKGCGQYCGSVSAAERTQTKEEHKRELFWKNVAIQTAKSAAFFLAALALIQGIVRFLPDSITVSSSVGGRELPIYKTYSRHSKETQCEGDLFYDGWLGTRIGIHERTEIWREIYELQRTSSRAKKGFEGRKIEVRVYI